MRRFADFTLIALTLLSPAKSIAQTADLVLVNGKIVTVDDRFTIAPALSIRGGRVVAVGTNADIVKSAGPATQIIDLAGRTVIPGLIDNHAHYMRAAEYWHRELRLDGVTSRIRAYELIAEKAKQSKPGEWILVLGGWSEEQFADDSRSPRPSLTPSRRTTR